MSARAMTMEINGIALYCEVIGSGEPLVLVHGGWSDHTTWQLVIPQLAESFQVIAYDRRGHSRTERPAVQGSRLADEQDLAELIGTLGIGPAHLVGNSLGASIVIGLAARRPDLVRSVIAHEPPLLGIADPDSPLQPQLREVRAGFEAVGTQLRAGEVEAGVQRFVEDMVFGPGAWALLPEPLRHVMVNNAPAYLDLLGDPHWADLDLAPISQRTWPFLLTDGERSPAWLPAIVGALAGAVSGIERHTFAGAGHGPQRTHPEEFVHVVREFTAAHTSAPVG